MVMHIEHVGSYQCIIVRVDHGHGVFEMGGAGMGMVFDFVTPHHTAYPCHGIMGTRYTGVLTKVNFSVVTYH
jgi:hypothetical protein